MAFTLRKLSVRTLQSLLLCAAMAPQFVLAQAIQPQRTPQPATITEKTTLAYSLRQQARALHNARIMSMNTCLQMPGNQPSSCVNSEPRAQSSRQASNLPDLTKWDLTPLQNNPTVIAASAAAADSARESCAGQPEAICAVRARWARSLTESLQVADLLVRPETRLMALAPALPTTPAPRATPSTGAAKAFDWSQVPATSMDPSDQTSRPRRPPETDAANSQWREGTSSSAQRTDSNGCVTSSFQSRSQSGEPTFPGLGSTSSSQSSSYSWSRSCGNDPAARNDAQRSVQELLNRRTEQSGQNSRPVPRPR